MKKRTKRSQTVSLRFDRTAESQERARRLLSALSGREVEPWCETDAEPDGARPATTEGGER